MLYSESDMDDIDMQDRNRPKANNMLISLRFMFWIVRLV